jgi:hypothetical protein
MVWRASFGVVGPYFLEDQNCAAATVTSAPYVHMLQNFVVPQINCLGRNCEQLWWQQDGATAHTARASVEVLRQMFPNRVISRTGDIPWPAKSPDLSACNFFLWGYLKGKVYTGRLNYVTVLKQRIYEEIQYIPDDMLRKVTAEEFLSKI